MNYFKNCSIPIKICKDDQDIITVIAPINVGLIKYFDDPNCKTVNPIRDYITVTLDPRAEVCAKTSVCARREFRQDEFWLNGKKGATQFAFCLNEVKYRAATQRSVSVEFLTRKVHIACENHFLPSPGSSSYAAGFMCLMTALCKLYKIRPDNIIKRPLFPDNTVTFTGGFVQRRAVSTVKYSKGKLIAEGKHWPELCVLIVIFKYPGGLVSTERFRGVLKISEYLNYRLSQTLPKNIKNIVDAIRGKNFPAFADTVMKDNNQYHAINMDTFPPRAYKTEASNKIVEVIHVYNKLCNETRVAYTFETGPNATLFFLEEHAKDVLSLIKRVFPTTKRDFIRGRCVPELDDEAFTNFPIAPMAADELHFTIYTKVGNVSAQFVTGNHLLDKDGNAIPSYKPLSVNSESSLFSNNVDNSQPDLLLF